VSSVSHADACFSASYLTHRRADYSDGQQAHVGLAGRRGAQGLRQCGVSCIGELANCSCFVDIRVINNSNKNSSAEAQKTASRGIENTRCL
jgi:hypothetical protein